MGGIELTVYKGSKDGKILKSTTYKADELAPNEVLVKITHSGVCGTDEHYRNRDIVLGHEGVGVVQKIGKDVKAFKVGDRAGWGYEHDSCGRCEQCLTGQETFCRDRHMYGTSEIDQGSFATHAVWKESFLFQIPDALESVDAAPLMCGGATVFNTLHGYGVKPTHRVGIVGVGGLGHLAIQFAAKMGCEVVVFSGTNSKKEEAMGLGATEFVAMKGVEELTIKPVNHLLVTTSAQPDWSLYLSAMASGGTIFPLGVSSGNLSIPYMPIIAKGLCIQGVLIAARNMHNKMLQFAAFHKIRPIIQTFPMSVEGIEEAMEKLKKGQVRYRAVLIAGHD
jgi:D-arabinose 1-dehydrogenase-like Zn-dependent alcohol dehydrogenase